MPSILIAVSILLWSSLGVFVRSLELQVQDILFYSTLFSLPFHMAFILATDLKRHMPSFKEFPYIFMLSVCLLLNTFTFLFAYKKTTIANAVLTHYIAPVIVAFLGGVFLKERITTRVIFSILIATSGLWIMLGGATVIQCLRSVASLGLKITDDMLGIISGLASGFFYAVLVILIRIFAQRLNPYVLVFLQNVFVILLLLPFVSLVSLKKMPLLAVMGLLHSTIAPYLYYYGLSRVQASRAAILGYLEPVGAILFSMVLLSEFPPVRSYVGGMLILLSGYLTITEKTR